MRKWLRRIRGAIGMGVTWAAALFVVGFVPRWVLGFYADLPFPILFGALGFIAGVIFSGLLVLTEGRRRFEEMSLPRFGAWGPRAAFCSRPSSSGARPLVGVRCWRSPRRSPLLQPPAPPVRSPWRGER